MALIRPAVAYDEGPFMDLWTAMLNESLLDVYPSSKSLAFCGDLFHAYTSGVEKGVVALADIDSEIVGALMWGSPIGGMPFDHRHGLVAIGWGTVVKDGYRGKGLSKQLREFGKEALRHLGFDAIHGTVSRKNPAALHSVDNFGFSHHSINVYISLWR